MEGNDQGVKLPGKQEFSSSKMKEFYWKHRRPAERHWLPDSRNSRIEQIKQTHSDVVILDVGIQRNNHQAGYREAHRAEISIGALYTTLNRLEQRGLIRSRVGDPTPQRGGRRKKYFLLKPLGERALAESFRAFKGMIAGLESRLGIIKSAGVE